MAEPPRFDAADVLTVAANLTADDPAYVIGGQATLLWAWYCADRRPLLATIDPTSKDIDYFGPRVIAERLAKVLGGTVRLPGPDDMGTPNTATLDTHVNGKPITIDFLHSVIGLSRRDLQTGYVLLSIANDPPIEIAVMHPIQCLKSRVANMLSPATQRRDMIAYGQLRAAIEVIIGYVDEALVDGDTAEAHSCFVQVAHYLQSDPYGRRVANELSLDPIAVLLAFADDERLDPRYRRMTLANMIRRVRRRRESRQRREPQAPSIA